MRRTVILSAVVLVALGAMAAARGQQAPAKQTIAVEKVKDNFYVLTSSSPADRATFSGGNVAVFITDAGTVLVDTKLAAWGQTLLDTIKTVTTKPVTTIVNTHTHGDHTGNNHLFGADVQIVAHETTKANMAKMEAFAGDKARFLPKRTYADRLSLGRGKDQIDLYYFGPGHTGGDTFVVFPALRILHTGDMFAWKDAPRIDPGNGGSGVRYPESLARAVAGIKNVETVVPGHSPVTTWKDFAEYAAFTRDLVTAAQAAKKAGKSVDEAAASIDLTGKYKGYASERVKDAVQAIYGETK